MGLDDLGGYGDLKMLEININLSASAIIIYKNRPIIINTIDLKLIIFYIFVKEQFTLLYLISFIFRIL